MKDFLHCIQITAALRKISEDTSILSFHVEHERLDEIVGLGEVAIPILIEHLREAMMADKDRYVHYDLYDYAPWYAMRALGRITGAQPIKPGNEGRLHAMCEDWYEWHDRNS